MKARDTTTHTRTHAQTNTHLIAPTKALVARVDGTVPILMEMRERARRSHVEVWAHERVSVEW